MIAWIQADISGLLQCKNHQRNHAKPAQIIKLAPMAETQGFTEE
jgi:hypothetical protein